MFVKLADKLDHFLFGKTTVVTTMTPISVTPGGSKPVATTEGKLGVVTNTFSPSGNKKDR